MLDVRRRAIRCDPEFTEGPCKLRMIHMLRMHQQNRYRLDQKKWGHYPAFMNYLHGSVSRRAAFAVAILTGLCLLDSPAVFATPPQYQIFDIGVVQKGDNSQGLGFRRVRSQSVDRCATTGARPLPGHPRTARLRFRIFQAAITACRMARMIMVLSSAPARRLFRKFSASDHLAKRHAVAVAVAGESNAGRCERRKRVGCGRRFGQ